MIKHDQLFKELLTTFFGNFIDVFVPDAAEYLDKSSITLLDKELFNDILARESRLVDLVVKAKFRGTDSFFVTLLEHNAQLRRLNGERLFFYFARLYEKYRLPVYPIALFSHESTNLEPGQFAMQFPGWQVLQFNYRVIQLSRLHWQDFLKYSNPVTCALMAKMGMRPEERPRVKLECLRLLASLRLDPARMKLISGFVDTYLRLNAEESLIFRRQTDILENEAEKGKIMEIVTSWMEEGIEIGRQQGWQKGRQEGELVVVLRLLRRRFGQLSPELELRLKVLSAEQVESLAEALLDFRSLQDLDVWLSGAASSSLNAPVT